MALAGRLQHQVTFKAPVVAQNEEGGPEVSYPVETFIAWAQVVRVNQFRALEANATALIDSDRFTIRWSLDRERIKKDWQMLHEGREYVIHSIEVEKGKEIRILAKAKE